MQPTKDDDSDNDEGRRFRQPTEGDNCDLLRSYRAVNQQLCVDSGVFVVKWDLILRVRLGWVRVCFLSAPWRSKVGCLAFLPQLTESSPQSVTVVIVYCPPSMSESSLSVGCCQNRRSPSLSESSPSVVVVGSSRNVTVTIA